MRRLRGTTARSVSLNGAARHTKPQARRTFKFHDFIGLVSCGAPVVMWLFTRAKNGRTRRTNYSSYSEMPAEPGAGHF